MSPVPAMEPPYWETTPRGVKTSAAASAGAIFCAVFATPRAGPARPIGSKIGSKGLSR